MFVQFFYNAQMRRVRMELTIKAQGRTANSQAHVVRKHGNDSARYRLLLRRYQTTTHLKPRYESRRKLITFLTGEGTLCPIWMWDYIASDKLSYMQFCSSNRDPMSVQRFVVHSKVTEMKKVTAHCVGIVQTSLNNRQCIINLTTAQSCFDGNRLDIFRINLLGNHIHNLHQFYRLLYPANMTSFNQPLLNFVL
jgi:hypothetical protein